MRNIEPILLGKTNYLEYDLRDILALSIAEPGAMGDPGSILIVSSQGDFFYVDITYDQLSSVCPIVKDVKLDMFGKDESPIGWIPIYLGCGNHLFIKDTIYEQFQLGQKKKFKENQDILLYNIWLDIVLDCIDGKFNVINDKLKGVIFGQAIGDALGLCTEFMNKAEIDKLYPHGVKFFTDMYHDAHRKRWLAGEWTDDTDMMLCIANAIIADKGVNLSHIARNFKEWACDNPRGIGVSTFKVLSIGDYVEKPFEVSKLIWKMNRKQSAANGGLMRTSIVGILPCDIEKHAADICRLTHYDPRCVGSCVIVSELIHSLVYKSFPLSFEQIIDLGNKYDERIKKYIQMAKDGTIESLDLTNEQSMGYTLKTLSVALWAYWHCSTFEEGLQTVVNAGGDSDTNSAVACAILGAKFGFSSIPDVHINGLLYKDKLDDIIDRMIKFTSIGIIEH